MTPEEFKEKWRKLNDMPNGDLNGNRRGENNHDSIIDDVVSSKAKSAREKLISSYRAMFALVAPLGLSSIIPIHQQLPLWGIILVIAFFITAAAMDYYLYRGIRSIDVSVDGIDEVAAKARFYRRRHHLFQAILIPIAIIIVSMFFCYMTLPEMRIGMYAGLAIGIAAGFAIYIRMMHEYKRML